LTGLPQKPASQPVAAPPPAKTTGRKWLLPALLAGGLCVLLGIFAFFALTSPVFASIVKGAAAPAPTQEVLWAPVDMAKPEGTPVAQSAEIAQAADTATALPTEVPPTTAPTEAPPASPTATEAATQEPTLEPPAATDTPGAITLEIVPDTPTSEYVATKPTPEIAVGNGERWIDVDLTNQRLYAYEGDVAVNSFIVSTGTWLTPTVTGSYKIYVKYRSASMTGPDYYLPDVPYVMYFYNDYAIHGTYWHNNFGTPMSHGCVNLRTEDAQWLYNWSSVGTVVNVHY
jgi:lipoprotein-anchoring transpeptidase ErfK/SrfK